MQHTYLPLTPAEIFWRQYKYEEFDVCEMSLSTLLLTGEIDAIATAVIPKRLGQGIKRLIPNYFEAEREYFKQTRAFPIMHTLVTKDLY